MDNKGITMPVGVLVQLQKQIYHSMHNNKIPDVSNSGSPCNL